MATNKPFSIPTGLKVTFEDKDYSEALRTLLEATERLNITDAVLAGNAPAREAIAAAEAGRRVDEAGLMAVVAAAPPEWVPHIAGLVNQGKSSFARVTVTRDLVLPVKSAVGGEYSEINLKGFDFHLEGVDAPTYSGSVGYVRNPPETLTLHKYIGDRAGEEHVSVTPAALEAAARAQNNRYHYGKLGKEIAELNKEINNVKGSIEQTRELGLEFTGQLPALEAKLDELCSVVVDKEAQRVKIAERVEGYNKTVAANPVTVLGVAGGRATDVEAESIEAILDEYEESLDPATREDTDYNMEASQSDYEKTSGYMIYGDQKAAARDREDKIFEREGNKAAAENFVRMASEPQQNAYTAFQFALGKGQDLDLAITACSRASSPEVDLNRKMIYAMSGPNSNEKEIQEFIDNAPGRLYKTCNSSWEEMDAAVSKVLEDGISGLPTGEAVIETAMKRAEAEKHGKAFDDQSRGLQSRKADQMLEQAKSAAAPAKAATQGGPQLVKVKGEPMKTQQR